MVPPMGMPGPPGMMPPPEVMERMMRGMMGGMPPGMPMNPEAMMRMMRDGGGPPMGVPGGPGGMGPHGMGGGPGGGPGGRHHGGPPHGSHDGPHAGQKRPFQDISNEQKPLEPGTLLENESSKIDIKEDGFFSGPYKQERMLEFDVEKLIEEGEMKEELTVGDRTGKPQMCPW